VHANVLFYIMKGCCVIRGCNSVAISLLNDVCIISGRLYH